MTARRLTVVAAGLSQTSSTRLLADQLAAATVHGLGDLGTVPEVEIIELRDHAHDLATNLLTGATSTRLRELTADVVDADALIVVTPIFNTSYCALFRWFFDLLDPGSLEGLPVLLATTGGPAQRSAPPAHNIRSMFAGLGSEVVPTVVHAAPQDWDADGTGDRGLAERIGHGACELAITMIAVHRPGAGESG